MTDLLQLDTDASSRRLLYICAWLLIVIPILQAGQALWPIQLSDIRWRFSAANAMSSILLLPFVGLVIMATVARATDNRTIARAVSALSALFVIGLLGSLVLFGLDALQLKTVVTSQQSESFQSTSFRVVFVTIVFTVSFSLLMLAAFRSSRDKSTAANKKDSKSTTDAAGLLVGRG